MPVAMPFTAMPELCDSGWVTTGERWYDMSQGSWFKGPHVHSILEQLERAYDARDDVPLRESARAFAEGYDVRRVMLDHWIPTLTRIEEHLDGRLVMPEVKLNRAMRRSKERAA